MNMRYKVWITTGLILALFFIGQARAQTKLYWDTTGNIIASESQANIDQRMQLTRDLSAYNQARNAGAIKSAAVASGEVVATRAATLSIPATAGMGKAVVLGMEEFVRYPLASVGKGMVNAARLTPWGIVGTVAGSLLLDAGISYLNGQWQKQLGVNKPGGSTVDWNSTGWSKTSGGPYNGTAGTLAATYCPGPSYTVRNITLLTGGVSAYVYCTNVNTGAQVNGGYLYGASSYHDPVYDTTPAADADISKAISDGLTAHPEKAADVLKNIYDNGGYVPLDAADKAGFNIPAQGATGIDGKPRQTVLTKTENGQTLTTTTTATPKAKVSTSGTTAGDNSLTVDVSEVTTTETKDAAGNVVSSSTSTQDKSADAFSDKDMPAVPKLYTQKYPDGIGGVWRDSKPDISNTAFFNGIKSMFPSFGGGQCPVWRMSFNLGAAGNFGSGDLTVPCWIFQALGLVILATAAFTSRKILF